MNSKDGMESLCRVFANVELSVVDDLAAACRYIGHSALSQSVIDNVEKIDKKFHELLNVALEGRADNDDTKEVDLRRAKLALRILVNASNRSQKLCSSVTSKDVNLFRALLRIKELRVETCALLVAVTRHLHQASALSSDYPPLLSDLALLWESESDRSWITAFFSILIEIDYAFLAHSYADFSPFEAFTALVRITETIMDYSETDITIKVHPNNVLFCVDLLERIFYDFGEGNSEKSSHYVEQMLYAVQIIGNSALKREFYHEDVTSKPRCVDIIVDILECVLHAQAITEEREKLINPPTVKPGRPEIPETSRIKRVEEDKCFLATSTAILNSSTEIRADLKCSAVMAIGNLCCDDRNNQLAAGERAVIRVLQCTKVSPNDRTFLMQWSIATLRHLCWGCSANQDVILSIDENPSAIIDREKLLGELGFVFEIDENSGKTIIKRQGGQ